MENFKRSWVCMISDFRFSGKPGSRIEDRGSRIEDPGSRIQDPGSRMEDRGAPVSWKTRIEDRGSSEKKEKIMKCEERKI